MCACCRAGFECCSKPSDGSDDGSSCLNENASLSIEFRTKLCVCCLSSCAGLGELARSMAPEETSELQKVAAAFKAGTAEADR